MKKQKKKEREDKKKEATKNKEDKKGTNSLYPKLKDFKFDNVLSSDSSEDDEEDSQTKPIGFQWSKSPLDSDDEVSINLLDNPTF